jgi:hypothetical protein
MAGPVTKPKPKRKAKPPMSAEDRVFHALCLGLSISCPRGTRIVELKRTIVEDGWVAIIAIPDQPEERT